MPAPPTSSDVLCNSLALRQAARHVSGFYNTMFAPLGLRGTQYSMLSRLHAGPRSIVALADELVMDRTTLSRNIRPLERRGLLTIGPDAIDRRSRVVTITPAGAALLERARDTWRTAQARFEAAFGAARAAELRRILAAVAATKLE